jgi:hypothetical protein
MSLIDEKDVKAAPAGTLTLEPRRCEARRSADDHRRT